MGMHRKELIAIGGYDEDFTGVGYDDADIMDRLKLNGCFIQRVDAMCVHLYHSRAIHKDRDRQKYNKKLYRERRGTIVRNENIEWGKLES